MMISCDQSHESDTPSSLPLHISLDSVKNSGLWKTHSNLEDEGAENEPTESSTGSFNGSERLTPQTPSNEEKSDTFTIPRSNSGNNIKRIREQRQRRRASVGGEVDGALNHGPRDVLPEKQPDPLPLSGSSIQRIRAYRNQRTASIGEGLDGSSSHSKGPAITWRRQHTKRLHSLAENNEMEENPLLSPTHNRIHITRKYSSGTSTRTLTRGSSGTSTRTLTRGSSGGSSSRTLTRGSSGTSSRGLERDSNGSKRSLMQNRQTQSMRSLNWTRNCGTASRSSRNLTRNTSGGTAARIRDQRSLSQSEHGGGNRSRTPTRNASGGTAARIRDQRSLSQSEHGGGNRSRTPTRNVSGGTAAQIREQRSLSKSEHGRGRRRMPVGLSEHLKADDRSASGISTSSSISGASIDNLPANSNVKGTTLELLALIKKRRRARAKPGDGTSSERLSLSPIPARRAKPGRRRSSSFSPNEARKRLDEKKIDETTSREPFSPGSVGNRKQLGKSFRAPFSPDSAARRKRLENLGEKISQGPFSPGSVGSRKRLGKPEEKASRSPFSPNSAARRKRLSNLEEKIAQVPFSPSSVGRRKRFGTKKLGSVRTMPLPVENQASLAEGADLLHHSSHSIPEKAASRRVPLPSSSHDSLGSHGTLDTNESGLASFNSFQDDEGDALSDLESDEESYESPKGVMGFPHSSQDKTTTQEIDSVHQEKLKQMRAEMEALQKQLGKMEEDKASAIQVLRDDVDTRKAKMMQNAKKKIHSHLESEMELKIYTMEVEHSRLEKMKEVMEKGKGELREKIAQVQCDTRELMQENKRLDAENKEIHRMYTHLSKWIVKKKEQNKKLEMAEEKLKKIYSGSLALIVEEKLSNLFRRCIYRVAQGVNSCEGFDFELNEDVWDMIKEVEAECDKEVIDLHDVDEWEDDLAENETPLVGMRISAGLDDDDDKDLTMSIRTRSTIGSFDLSKRSRKDSFYRDDDDSISEEEDDYSESEREADEEFEEDLERLNDSVAFYENVLAEVSVNLDATQMNTLHENKDMLVSIFKFMDADGSGDIDLEEFKVGIELLNKRLPESSRFQDAEELFKLLDVDNSGSIDLEEFERVFDDD
ncbi:unnamed protein product [Cylindrotheca closterium]|uniref:EF-hand domain-containing protein n=1 Tax=Cylindrotheca closterium TaxID=2856 RepID=A0AAD2FNV1_9STRA|nr:unnamed protein product [Cylindrotheca closterium]